MSEVEQVTKAKHPSIERKRVDGVLEAALASAGDALSVEEKTGWTKVTSKASGNKVYIQNREDVREVHLSGFGGGLAGTVPPPRKNGKVEAHLDMSGDDPYAALAAVLGELAGQQAAAKPAPAPKAPKEPKAKPVSDDERVARIKERVTALGLDGEKEPEQPEVALDSTEAIIEESEVTGVE